VETIEQAYKRELKYQRSSSAAMKLFIALSVLSNLGAGAWFLFFQAPGEAHSTLSRIWAFASTCIFLGGLLWIWVRYRRAAHASSAPTIAAAPKETSEKVQRLCSELASRLGIELKPVNVLLNRRRFDVGPSIWEHSKHIDLVLPLGFLKVLRVEPQNAEAMLAHELGHVRAGDTRLWAFVSAYWSGIVRVFFPLNLLVLVGLPLVAAVNDLRAMTPNQEAYRERLADLDRLYGVEYKDKTPEQVDQIENSLPWQYQHMGYSLDRYILDDQLARSGVDWVGVGLSEIPTGLGILMLLGVFSSMRESRRRSEFLADLTAFSVVGSAPLLACLGSEEGSGGRFFRVHPTRQQRRRTISKFESLWGPAASIAHEGEAKHRIARVQLRTILLTMIPIGLAYQVALDFCSDASRSFLIVAVVIGGSCTLGWMVGRATWERRPRRFRAWGSFLSATAIFMLTSHLLGFFMTRPSALEASILDLTAYADARGFELGISGEQLIASAIGEVFWFVALGTVALFVTRRGLSRRSLLSFG
jgi:hypothetical protein